MLIWSIEKIGAVVLKRGPLDFLQGKYFSMHQAVSGLVVDTSGRASISPERLGRLWFLSALTKPQVRCSLLTLAHATACGFGSPHR